MTLYLIPISDLNLAVSHDCSGSAVCKVYIIVIWSVEYSLPLWASWRTFPHSVAMCGGRKKQCLDTIFLILVLILTKQTKTPTLSLTAINPFTFTILHGSFTASEWLAFDLSSVAADLWCYWWSYVIINPVTFCQTPSGELTQWPLPLPP